MIAVKAFLEDLGRRTIGFFTMVHEICLLAFRTVRSLSRLWFYRRQFIEQLYVFSLRTLPIVAIIAVFVGLGAMVQGKYQTSAFIPRAYTINVIFKTTIIELCPVILALVLAGKLGASLAAEIGSMKISEQVDALSVMSLEPEGFLVMPRVLAGVVMLPVLTVFGNFIAMLSNFFVSSVVTEWISAQEFVRGLQMDFRPFEMLLGCAIKPALYGFLITLLGSYFGLRADGGARGVGQAATNAVVTASVIIVFFDYYLGTILL